MILSNQARPTMTTFLPQNSSPLTRPTAIRTLKKLSPKVSESTGRRHQEFPRLTRCYYLLILLQTLSVLLRPCNAVEKSDDPSKLLLCGSEPIFGPGTESDGPTGGEIQFPKDWSVYQIKSAYTCRWSFIPVTPDQRVRIRFTKFRTDQRCFMKDRTTTSARSNYSCHVHTSYKYPLEAINRIMVYEIPVSSDIPSQQNSPVTANNGSAPSTSPFSSGCLCGTGESTGTDGSDKWWFFSSNPGPRNGSGGGIRVEFVVPRPHIGLMFKMEYEFLSGMTGCGGHSAENDIEGWVTSPRYPNPYPAGIVCEWNITLPSSLEKYGGKINDWQMLLNFTNIIMDFPNKSKDFVEAGLDPETSSRDQLFLMYESEGPLSTTNPTDDNTVSILPLVVPKSLTRAANFSEDWPWLFPILESRGNAVVLRLISKPTPVKSTTPRHIPLSTYGHPFKLRWSPFLKHKDIVGKRDGCKHDAFPCEVLGPSKQSQVSKYGLNSNRVDGGREINDSTSLLDGGMDSYHCLPPNLLCNGYVECPNSSEDEEEFMCKKREETATAVTNHMHKLGPWPPYVAVVGSQTVDEIDKTNNANGSSTGILGPPDTLDSGSDTTSTQARTKNRTLLILLCIFLPLFLLTILTVTVVIIRKITGRKSRYNVKYYNTTTSNYKLHREDKERATDPGPIVKSGSNGITVNGSSSNGNGIGRGKASTKVYASSSTNGSEGTGFHNNTSDNENVAHESYIPLVATAGDKRENGYHTAI